MKPFRFSNYPFFQGLKEFKEIAFSAKRNSKPFTSSGISVLD
jgi:hypothetical protein